MGGRWITEGGDERVGNEQVLVSKLWHRKSTWDGAISHWGTLQVSQGGKLPRADEEMTYGSVVSGGYIKWERKEAATVGEPGRVCFDVCY